MATETKRKNEMPLPSVQYSSALLPLYCRYRYLDDRLTMMSMHSDVCMVSEEEVRSGNGNVRGGLGSTVKLLRK